MSTAWPTTTDLATIASAMGVTFGASIGSAFQTQVLGAVTDSIKSRTRRLFEVESGGTRYYDGTGTGQMEIDEFTTISTLEIVGWYGLTSGLILQEIHEVQRYGFPKTMIQIFKGSLPALGRNWVDRFPVGRSNIKIIANWGYDTTIPQDLWYAAAYQATALLLNMKQYDEDGYLIKMAEADVTEVRNRMDPFKFFNSSDTFSKIVRRYAKPSGYYLRKQNRQIV